MWSNLGFIFGIAISLGMFLHWSFYISALYILVISIATMEMKK